jgi:hypothetical protein
LIQGETNKIPPSYPPIARASLAADASFCSLL